jgi:hypothetical protein
MERSETLSGEKKDRANGVLLALLVAVLVAYGLTAFGIYELVDAIA